MSTIDRSDDRALDLFKQYERYQGGSEVRQPGFRGGFFAGATDYLDGNQFAVTTKSIRFASGYKIGWDAALTASLRPRRQS